MTDDGKRTIDIVEKNLEVVPYTKSDRRLTLVIMLFMIANLITLIVHLVGGFVW